ncbi:hypothetical protein LBMAG21_06060 [Armatimonadota bacterium]|nr:hypothetical protein LBMAG21_06060 [Armatimonadota bacterium]
MVLRHSFVLLLLPLSLIGCQENKPSATLTKQVSVTPSAPHAPSIPLRPRLFFVLERGNTNRKEIALTFDDGPHPEFTPMLLDRLKHLKVHATFFMVGEMVKEAPQLAKRIVEEGHEAGNHSFSHPNLKTISSEEVAKEIEQGSEQIRKACGVDPLFFRPPGGNYNEEVMQVLIKAGMPLALWTYNPKDFARPPADQIERGILQNAQNGMIVLLHSSIMQTYEILPALVANLRKQGYTFVTLTDMAQHSPELADRIAHAKQLN